MRSFAVRLLSATAHAGIAAFVIRRRVEAEADMFVMTTCLIACLQVSSYHQPQSHAMASRIITITQPGVRIDASWFHAESLFGGLACFSLGKNSSDLS